MILVPGKVLGNGSLDHKVKVAAMSFSKSAEEKSLQPAENAWISLRLSRKTPREAELG